MAEAAGAAGTAADTKRGERLGNIFFLFGCVFFFSLGWVRGKRIETEAGPSSLPPSLPVLCTNSIDPPNFFFESVHFV